jgi:pilus assembly protein CpaD
MTMMHRILTAVRAFGQVSRVAGLGLAVTLGLGLGGCASVPSNTSMYSDHQPIVERVNYTLDLATGNGGLSYPEQQRLAGWFDELGLRYGDRLSIQDPMQDPATLGTIDSLAGRYGIAAEPGTPDSPGFVEAGTTRVVISRSKAIVRGCPDWADNSDFNPKNGLSRNFGCATNSNLAAMVANPDHLINGDDSGSGTTIMTSNKAINAYRTQTPTGANGIRSTSSRDN